MKTKQQNQIIENYKQQLNEILYIFQDNNIYDDKYDWIGTRKDIEEENLDKLPKNCIKIDNNYILCTESMSLKTLQAFLNHMFYHTQYFIENEFNIYIITHVDELNELKKEIDIITNETEKEEIKKIFNDIKESINYTIVDNLTTYVEDSAFPETMFMCDKVINRYTKQLEYFFDTDNINNSIKYLDCNIIIVDNINEILLEEQVVQLAEE